MNTTFRIGKLRRFLRGALLGGLAAAGLWQPTLAADQTTATVPAVWQEYELPFHYFGHDTYYTCSGLEDRLKSILRQLGAADDAKVSASGCFGINEVSRVITARIRVKMLMAAPTTAIDTMPARYTPVTLKTAQFGSGAEPACELLEAVARQLLPELKLEIVEQTLHCVPGQASSFSHALQVRALLPVAGTP